MISELLTAAIGLVILLLAGEALVRGAVNMSLRLGVPALIVSLTVVAFGTSAPELLVSIQAVLTGVPGLAMGNVVGSNIANVLLVLGVPAAISGIAAAHNDSRQSYWMMLAATALFIVSSFFRPIDWINGLVLLAALGAILTVQFRTARSHRKAADDVPLEEIEGADPGLRWWKILVFLALGLVGLPIGADILIDSSVEMAETLGISDTVIGLTLVAIGTSLPELATSVVAAIRRHADVAIGNVIGSNIFNLLAIIGITGLVAPVPVDLSLLRFDLWVMLGAALALGPFVIREWRMSRGWGILFLGLYCVYLWLVVTG